MKLVAFVLVIPALVLCLNVGCSHEVAHTESTHENLLGGETHQEKTVVEHPNGSMTVEKHKQSTGGL